MVNFYIKAVSSTALVFMCLTALYPSTILAMEEEITPMGAAESEESISTEEKTPEEILEMAKARVRTNNAASKDIDASIAQVEKVALKLPQDQIRPFFCFAIGCLDKANIKEGHIKKLISLAKVLGPKLPVDGRFMAVWFANACMKKEDIRDVPHDRLISLGEHTEKLISLVKKITPSLPRNEVGGVFDFAQAYVDAQAYVYVRFGDQPCVVEEADVEEGVASAKPFTTERPLSGVISLIELIAHRDVERFFSVAGRCVGRKNITGEDIKKLLALAEQAACNDAKRFVCFATNCIRSENITEDHIGKLISLIEQVTPNLVGSKEWNGFGEPNAWINDFFDFAATYIGRKNVTKEHVGKILLAVERVIPNIGRKEESFFNFAEACVSNTNVSEEPIEKLIELVKRVGDKAIVQRSPLDGFSSFVQAYVKSQKARAEHVEALMSLFEQRLGQGVRQELEQGFKQEGVKEFFKFIKAYVESNCAIKEYIESIEKFISLVEQVVPHVETRSVSQFFDFVVSCLQNENIHQETRTKVAQWGKIIKYSHKDGYDYFRENLGIISQNKDLCSFFLGYAAHQLEIQSNTTSEEIQNSSAIFLKLATCGNVEGRAMLISALANPDQPNPFHKGLALLPGLKANVMLRDLLLKEEKFEESLKIPSLVYEEPQELSQEEMGLLNNQLTQCSHIIGEEIAALQVLSLPQALHFPQEVNLDEEDMETSNTTYSEIKHQTEMGEWEEGSSTSTSYPAPSRTQPKNLLPDITQQHPNDLLAMGEQVEEIIKNDFCLIPITKEVYEFLNQDYRLLNSDMYDSYVSLVDKEFETNRICILTTNNGKPLEQYYITLFKENVKKWAAVLDFFMNKKIPDDVKPEECLKFRKHKKTMESAFVEAIEAKGQVKRVNFSKNQDCLQELRKVLLGRPLRSYGSSHDEEKGER